MSMKDPYLYPGSNVLKNKADIRDAEDLKVFESENVKIRMATVDKIENGYERDSYEHLKAIHRHLFEGVYEWAGQERIIDTFKEERVLGGRGSVEYAKCVHVPQYVQNAINAFQKTPWHKLNHEQKTEKFCDAVTDLWQAHPFREGNTRTITTFCTGLAKEYGFKMDEKLLSQHSEYYRNALVLSTLGKKDYLYKIVKDSIQRGKELPFDNLQDELKYEKLQEIRNCQTKTEQINSFTPSKIIYQVYAKEALEKTGNIWRKTTDQEIYKSMLQKGYSAKQISYIIKTESPELINQNDTQKLKYIQEIEKSALIKILKKEKGLER